MLASIVDGAALRFGDRPVVVAPDGTLSYSALARHSLLLANALGEQGIRPGDVVALALPSGGDWLVAAVAAARAGAAFAGISPVLSSAERSALVAVVKPDLILASPDLVDGLPLRSNVVVLEPGTRGGALASDRASELPSSDEERPAVICFTSGTTGTPKAAMFTGEQLRAIQRIDLGSDAEPVWDGGAPMLASTQFAHVGMATKLPWYFRRGVTLHVMERWRADDALRLVAEHRMPVIGAIAPQLALMLRSPLMDQLDFDSVQTVIAGGAASSPALVREVRRRFGAGYSIRYSSTESGGVGLATDPVTEDESEWTTVGRPRTGIEIRIADESGSEVGPGHVGELQLRSGATMHSYWNDPSATTESLTSDRWLRSGDLGRLDEHGRVVLVGRRSEMYIRGGYNVFPSEVEATLGTHPWVEDIVIVPVPDDVMGEIGVALVVPSGDRMPGVDDFREFGSGQLARHKLPQRVVRVEEVPLTSSQKVDRGAARELLGSIEGLANADQ